MADGRAREHFQKQVQQQRSSHPVNGDMGMVMRPLPRPKVQEENSSTLDTTSAPADNNSIYIGIIAVLVVIIAILLVYM